MIFKGFIYSNPKIHQTFVHANELLDKIFSDYTTPPEDTARDMFIVIPDEEHARSLADAFAPLKNFVNFDRDRMLAKLATDGIIGHDDDGALSHTFMNSCLSLRPDYEGAWLWKDVLGVFVAMDGHKLVLNMATLEALNSTQSGKLPIPPSAVADARDHAPAYLNALKSNLFKAGCDLLPEQHGARALRHRDYDRAESCEVKIYGFNEAGHIGLMSAKTVKPGDFDLRFGSGSRHVQRLRFDIMR